MLLKFVCGHSCFLFENHVYYRCSGKAPDLTDCQYVESEAGGFRAKRIQKEGEAVVELDQFKSILATYTEPLVEVRDSL